MLTSPRLRSTRFKIPGELILPRLGVLAIIIFWANSTGALTAADARSKSLPVMLMQGGIHAGEIDGKDAGFLLLREMMENRNARGALDKIVWVFVPVYNVDGHERFGRWNRPNQVGPEEMGWRVTSQNLNLNRDYMKADAPETQAMLRLLNEWDPILYVDLHVTDGAQFQHDISNTLEPIYMGDPQLQPLGVKLRDETNSRIATKGALPVPFYPSLRDNNDPTSGFEDGAMTPRFSTGYWPLSNRFAMLVETHSWKDYPTRVRLTHDTLLALTEIIAREMLARDPQIAAEFKQKLASDPEFVKDPDARLDFFYRHHSSWDERFNLYPVLRVNQPY